MLSPINSKINFNGIIDTSKKVDNLCRLIKDGSTDDALKEIDKTLLFLLEAGGWDSQTKLYPLHLAIQKENILIIKALCEKGVDIDKKNGKGLDSFHYAIQTGNPEIMGIIDNYSKKISCYFCQIL